MATLQERLTAAEAAYEALLLGKSVVEFRDSNGEMVRYGPANRSALAAYIANLKNQINVGSVAPPMGFFS